MSDAQALIKKIFAVKKGGVNVTVRTPYVVQTPIKKDAYCVQRYYEKEYRIFIAFLSHNLAEVILRNQKILEVSRTKIQ